MAEQLAAVKAELAAVQLKAKVLLFRLTTYGILYAAALWRIKLTLLNVVLWLHRMTGWPQHLRQPRGLSRWRKRMLGRTLHFLS